jgi:serine/threonine-protein kinase
VRIIVAPVPMPSQYAPDLPPTFDRWWERASQRDPNARFQSARELGDALALAFGQSQGLSGEGRAMQGDGTGPYPAGAPGSFGSTPNPALGSTPNPAFGNTPNPAFGMTPNPMFGNTPNPAFGNTPNPAYGNPNQRTPQPYAGTQPLQGVAAPTTGASMSRTYDNAPPQPPKSKGMIFGIAGAVVVVVIGAVGVSFALRGKDTTATTAPSAHASETSAAATPPPPTAPIPTVSTAAIDTARPPSTAVAEPPSAAPTAAAPTPPTAKPPTHAAPVPPAPRPPPAAPPPANNHNKPPKVDLGI